MISATDKGTILWNESEKVSETSQATTISIDSDAAIDAGNNRKSSSIAVLLPDNPVNVYVDGKLVKKAVSGRYEIITPDLPEGTFSYRVTIIDSNDYSKGRDFEIKGITAGKIVAVDLRT